MKSFEVFPIGEIRINGSEYYIQIDKKFCPALKSLNGFSHIEVIWWFSKFDDVQSRSVLQTPQPYKNAPLTMGTFATRSPHRPNPIALTTCQIIDLDEETGTIIIPFIDAANGSPVLDIKPYTPSLDRVENPQTPQWCSNWPKNTEESGFFDWSQVFNFTEYN